jgi:hypothetical protein
VPGTGVRTTAILLAAVGDGSSFPSAAHLASSAGLAPATRQSGTSIHGEHAPRGGNRQLNRAMFLSAFAALRDPASRGCYDRCRARGRTHTQSLLRLARHRIGVLLAMLRDRTFSQPTTPRLAWRRTQRHPHRTRASGFSPEGPEGPEGTVPSRCAPLAHRTGVAPGGRRASREGTASGAASRSSP